MPHRLDHLADRVDYQRRLADLNVVAAFLSNDVDRVFDRRGNRPMLRFLDGGPMPRFIVP